MYCPRHFRQEDHDQLHRLIAQYPFATLLSLNPDQDQPSIQADSLPLLLADDKQTLQGHIARANPLWKQQPDGAEVLILFQGPDSYISPDAYPSKREDGRAVPTWNYARVEVRGRIRFIHDDDWNRSMLEQLTARHEADRPVPWSIDDAPDDYIAKMLKAIVGVEIAIESIEGKWKASQNQPRANQLGVIDDLTRRAEQADGGKEGQGEIYAKEMATMIETELKDALKPAE